HAGGTDPVLIVDERVHAAHRSRINDAFPSGTARMFLVPSGESSKSVTQWNYIIDFTFADMVRRNTPVIAIGGGVTGDLAGFAAATLLRGLPLYHVPTTLLAMVDSAVGGKTGINHAFGKNTIGAFYQPEAVLFDTAFLDTLPQREWLCGISEVLKYGYIAEPLLLETAARLAEPHSRDRQILHDVITQSVRIKSSIVAEDTREAGKRAWLNFGHTFGHALETLDNYRHINHGEAVYAGMIAALHTSRCLGWEAPDAPLLEMKKIFGLALDPYTSRIDELVTLMTHDKKNRNSQIRLVLIEKTGSPVVHPVDDSGILRDAWKYTFDALA
ncbi:MAG: 3-dehydroquinate synthase, partial [Bacteroidota bacterium]